MPKTENLFAKLPPQIAHILEYSTMLRYDLTSSMYSSYYYLPRDLNQGQVSKWYNPTVFAISLTHAAFQIPVPLHDAVVHYIQNY